MYNSKCGRKYWRYEDHKYSVVLSFWFQKWHIVTIATTHAYLDLKPRQRIMDKSITSRWMCTLVGWYVCLLMVRCLSCFSCYVYYDWFFCRVTLILVNVFFGEKHSIFLCSSFSNMLKLMLFPIWLLGY